MRSKIRVNGLWYRPVPWPEDGTCQGCAFALESCINTASRGDPCNNGNEFGGMVLIRHTKEAYEQYCHTMVVRRFNEAARDGND